MGPFRLSGVANHGHVRKDYGTRWIGAVLPLKVAASASSLLQRLPKEWHTARFGARGPLRQVCRVKGRVEWMEGEVMDMDFDSHFGDDHYGTSGLAKFILGACALLGVLALGGFIGKMTSSSTPAKAPAALPAVSLQQQMQQAAIEALHTQQQMMIDMRRQMAEAESGYYEDRPAGNYGDFEDGNF